MFDPSFISAIVHFQTPFERRLNVPDESHPVLAYIKNGIGSWTVVHWHQVND
jgi:hypothetical protein